MDPLEVIPLGRTGLEVSRLGLGTAALGSLASDQGAAALAVLTRAVEVGIRQLDTAPRYGDGRAELQIGLATPTLDRSRMVVSTKVGLSDRLVGPGYKVRRVIRDTALHPRANLGLFGSRGIAILRRAAGRHPDGGLLAPRHEAVPDLTFDGAWRSIEASLRRLGADRVDILFIHEPIGPIGPVLRGAYRAIEQMRDQGITRCIGVGANDAAQLDALARAADLDCLLLGYQYSLMDQTASSSLLPYAHERGLPIIMGGPFVSGILADPRPGASYSYRPATLDELRRAQALESIAARHGVSLKAAAIQFPFRHPAVVSVLTGAASVAELEENVRHMRAMIPEALWDEYRHEGIITGEPGRRA